MVLKKDLATDKFEIHDNEICLLTNNHYETDFVLLKIGLSQEGAEIVDVKLENLVDEEKRGVVLKENVVLYVPHPDLIKQSFRKIGLLHWQIKAEQRLTSIDIRIPHANIGWNDAYKRSGKDEVFVK